jgi:hypothetical protein
MSTRRFAGTATSASSVSTGRLVVCYTSAGLADLLVIVDCHAHRSSEYFPTLCLCLSPPYPEVPSTSSSHSYLHSPAPYLGMASLALTWATLHTPIYIIPPHTLHTPIYILPPLVLTWTLFG